VGTIELLFFADREGAWRASLAGVRLEARASTLTALLAAIAPELERRVAEERLIADVTAAMREKLSRPENRAKGAWSNVSPQALHGRVHEETLELLQAINQGDATNAMLEAADVALFAAMAAQNVATPKREPVVERPDRAGMRRVCASHGVAPCERCSVQL
jgi:NTP pyrophosphatase (non-canonical NTP hydrolase)